MIAEQKLSNVYSDWRGSLKKEQEIFKNKFDGEHTIVHAPVFF